MDAYDSILPISNVNYKYAFIENSNKHEVFKNLLAFKIENIQTKYNERFSNIESFLKHQTPRNNDTSDSLLFKRK